MFLIATVWLVLYANNRRFSFGWKVTCTMYSPTNVCFCISLQHVEKSSYGFSFVKIEVERKKNAAWISFTPLVSDGVTCLCQSSRNLISFRFSFAEIQRQRKYFLSLLIRNTIREFFLRLPIRNLQHKYKRAKPNVFFKTIWVLLANPPVIETYDSVTQWHIPKMR
jgi:hypothetical protein